MQCDFAFIDPTIAATFSSEVLFDDEYFNGGGAGYANYLEEAPVLEAHGRRYGELLAKVGARSVLDVGAASGFILRGMHAAGLTGSGIEPNATMASYAVDVLGIDVQALTLERYTTDERFDAVSMLQVVDHLEDVDLACSTLAAVTRPGGWCLIEFGDRASMTARILGKAWHEYAPPTVQRVFSLRALTLLLAKYGFILQSSGHPKKYLHADHALSLLQYKSGERLGSVFARLATIVPPTIKLRYPGDDITWALFCKR